MVVMMSAMMSVMMLDMEEFRAIGPNTSSGTRTSENSIKAFLVGSSKRRTEMETEDTEQIDHRHHRHRHHHQHAWITIATTISIAATPSTTIMKATGMGKEMIMGTMFTLV